MFLYNKYTNWYFNIINDRKFRLCEDGIYYERHHIVPKCIGGDDSDENLVSLTAREHFIVHWLLTKMVTGNDKRKLKYAFASFCRSSNGNKRILTSWQYKRVREELGELGKYKRTDEWKRKLSERRTGQKHSEFSKNKIRENRKGKATGKRNNEWKNNISKSLKGKKFTDTQKENMKVSKTKTDVLLKTQQNKGLKVANDTFCFYSARKASEFIGVDKKTISRWCKIMLMAGII